MKSNIELFKDILFAQNYSKNSKRSYSQALNIVSQNFNLQLASLEEIEFLDFVIKLKKENKSFAYIKNIVMATKLFYSQIHNFHFRKNYMQNMKKPEALPDILSLGEVKLLIDTLDNLKHKTIISVIYSCGRESVNV